MNQALTESARGGLPADPRNVKVSQIGYDAVIEAAAIKSDWPTLFRAIDEKIHEQRQFVQWWEAAVSVRESPGRGGIKSSADLGSISRAQAERDTGITHQVVSNWRKRLSDEDKYRQQQILAAFRKAGLEPPANHRAEGTGENEWFTPAQYIAAAREVMGDIDLDPASHPVAQQTVQAFDYYTAEDDGLLQQWHGRVWLNPPYVQPLIAQFVTKLLDEIEAGRVSQAILLTHNYTDTAWFHEAEAIANLLCFTRGRIKFVDADGEECAPTQGQAFFYYGPHIERFADVFRRFGFVR